MRRHISQACDSCKRRKAKCDGQPPQCSRCRDLGIDCHYNIPQTRRGPKPRTSTARSISSRGPSATPDHNLDQSLGSPSTITGISSPIVPPSTPIYPRSSPREIHQQLSSTLEYLGVEPEPLARHCIDLWTDRSFPIMPCFRPMDLLQSIPLLLPTARDRFESTVDGAPSWNQETNEQALADMRAFTLLCAICAQSQAFRITSDGTSPRKQALASAFFTSSRAMLACCEDADVSQPDLCSPLIRVLHSAMLHFQGKNRMSRYLIGQALRLIVDMRLFEEKTYEKFNELESQMRRNMFWLMYTIDKSLALLNNLPPTLHEHLEDLTHVERAPNGDPIRLLDDVSSPKYQPPYEDHLRQAFNMVNRQWLLAGDMFRDLDLLASLSGKDAAEAGEGLSSLEKNLTSNYTAFCSLLDSAPSWLSNPESYTLEGQPEEVITPQRQGFWIQHANIIVNYHCLRLVLMVKAFKLGYIALMGLVPNEELFALRNTEIACELLHDTSRMPPQALQGNGEAMVEKLRQVGVILLQISHQVSNSTIVARAKMLLNRLLDLIASLDSKSSDKLGGEAP